MGIVTVNRFPPSYVSRAELLSTFEGDTEFVEDLVTIFLERCPALIDELRAAFKAGDAVAVSRAAHSMKGSLGYFEHGGGLAAAKELEAITAAEMSRGPELMATLEHHVDALTSYLNQEFHFTPVTAAL